MFDLACNNEDFDWKKNGWFPPPPFFKTPEIFLLTYNVNILTRSYSDKILTSGKNNTATN